MLCFYDFSCVYVMWCQIFLTLHLIEDMLPQNSSTLKVVGSCGMGISMSWYSKNSSLTLSCSSGPLKGSSSWNLKRAPCVKNGLSICFVTMVQIKLKVLNMLKSWKMWNPCLSMKYRASSTPHSVLCCTSTNWACFSRASFRGSFLIPYSTALTRNASAACWNSCTSWGVMSPVSSSLLRVALVVKPIFSFSPDRQRTKRDQAN